MADLLSLQLLLPQRRQHLQRLLLLLQLLVLQGCCLVQQLPAAQLQQQLVCRLQQLPGPLPGLLQQVVLPGRRGCRQYCGASCGPLLLLVLLLLWLGALLHLLCCLLLLLLPH